MADVTLTDVFLGRNGLQDSFKSGGLLVVKAAIAPTSAFTGYVTSWVVVDMFARGDFVITWVLGDETSLECEVSTAEDGTGTLPIPDDIAAAPSAGVSSVAPVILQYLKANYTTTGYIRIPLELQSVDRVRLRCRMTGGTPTGTLAIAFKGGRGDR